MQNSLNTQIKVLLVMIVDVFYHCDNSVTSIKHSVASEPVLCPNFGHLSPYVIHAHGYRPVFKFLNTKIVDTICEQQIYTHTLSENVSTLSQVTTVNLC